MTDKITPEKKSALSRLRQTASRRDPCFFVILAICAVLFWLAVPLFSHRSFRPVIFNYSLGHAAFIIIAMFLPASMLFLAIRGGRSATRKLTASAIITAFMAELLVRLAVPAPPLESEALRAPAPYFMFSGREGAVIPWDPRMGFLPEEEPPPLDSMGLRNEQAMSKVKPEDEFRIVVLGGSTVFNGNPLSNSIPELIESMLNERGFENAAVYNCAIVGAISGQELALLVHLLSDYRPDLIIVYDGGNDILHPWFYDPRPGYPYNFMALEQGMDAMNGSLTPSQALSSLLRRSKLLRLFYRSALVKHSLPIADLREQVSYGSPDWEQAVIASYTSNLRKMAGFAKGMDVPVCFFLQPMLALKEPVKEEEKVFLLDEDLNDYARRQYRRASEAYAAMEGLHSGSEQIRFFDLSEIMLGYEDPAYWDMIHTDNAGNRHIAEHIVKRLLATPAFAPRH